MWNERTPDPVGDWEKKCRKDDEIASAYPVCHICGGHIMQYTAVRMDGKWYCDECLDEMRQCIEI